MNKKQIQQEQDRAFELVKNNKIQEAKTIYQEIIKNDPTNDAAHHMLSFTYVLNGDFEKALIHITEAIKLYKCCADYYNTAGSILRDMNKLNEAFIILKEGLKCNPNNAETYNNLGLVLNDLGEYDKAKLCFQSSISLEPNAAFVHFNYALTLLKTGDYDNGWKEYEWRHRLTSPISPTLPQQTDLKNKSFILHHEQGFGDTIQFIRYAQLLKQHGAKEINVSVPKPLENLVKSCP
jgi:tetratricopeptide (TPR) repeat protein